MKIYLFAANGQYIGQSTADESPLEPGVFVLPANATEIEPPEVGAGFVAMFNGAGWTIQVAPMIHDEAPKPPTEAEIRKAAIEIRLACIDGESVRPSREITASMAAGIEVPPFALEKLAKLEAEAHALRLEMRGL